MKYKLINTDLIYKGTLYSEGCILEIDSKDADSISEYLKPIESHPEPADQTAWTCFRISGRCSVISKTKKFKKQ